MKKSGVSSASTQSQETSHLVVSDDSTHISYTYQACFNTNLGSWFCPLLCLLANSNKISRLNSPKVFCILYKIGLLDIIVIESHALSVADHLK